MEAVDRLQEHGLRLAGRLRHRVQRHAVVDPAGRVALEHEVRQRRQQHVRRRRWSRRSGPHPRCRSALVMPPIRKSATSAGDASAAPLAPRAREVDADVPLVEDMVEDPLARLRDRRARRPAAPRPRRPRRRARASTSQNASCSFLARLTQITSSNSSSSAFDGVSRVCSRPGRCTMHLAQLPDLGIDVKCHGLPPAQLNAAPSARNTQVRTKRIPSSGAMKRRYLS